MNVGLYTVIQLRVAVCEFINLAVVLYDRDGAVLGWREARDWQRIEAFNGGPLHWSFADSQFATASASDVAKAAARPYADLRPRELCATVIATDPHETLNRLATTFLDRRRP